jgi:hypothetical protein
VLGYRAAPGTKGSVRGAYSLRVPQDNDSSSNLPAPAAEPRAERSSHQRRVPLLRWLGRHDRLRIIDWLLITAVGGFIGGLAVWFLVRAIPCPFIQR